jgi:GNAT superfamily N-acetyltransferase
MSAVTIETARLGDSAVIAELGARTFTEAFASENKPEDMAAYVGSTFTPERMAREIEAGGIFFIARAEGRPVGYAKLARGEPPDCVKGSSPIELVRLYVVRELHGRGVAHALMEACLAESRRLGRETLWLGVWERNPRAQSFYRKWGFVDVGSQPFVLGSDVQTDRVFVRAVSP